MTDNKFENYEKFLEIVDDDLRKIFDFQKEYIFCKKGCSYCCQRGDYPMTQLEFDYLLSEYELLSDEQKQKIKESIEILKNEDTESYKCPFLIDNSCSVYKKRPIVCRTFGVLTEDSKGNPSFPFCTTQGLNFSQIYDKEKKHLSYKLYEQGNFKNIPKIFRLSNKVVINLPLVKELNIEFGKAAKLIDFIKKTNI